MLPNLQNLKILFGNPTDGDSTSLPLIFEDRYQDNGDANRRRTGSDPHISTGPCTKSKSSGFNNNNAVMINGTKTKECSCGINGNGTNNYSLEPLPKLNSTNLIGVMTPRFALGGDILQASLTIIPAAAQNGLRGKTLSRHSVSNVLESEPQWDGFREIYVPSNGGGTLPTRHSKSLDQLETQQDLVVNSLPRQNTLTNQHQISLIAKPQAPALTYYQPLSQHHSKKNATAEDLLKNINEFKEKYKNPIDSTRTLAQLTNDVHPNKLTNGTLNNHLNQTPVTIFPKSIHVNSSTNVLTLNRVTHSSNNPKTDYVHELKLSNNNQNPVGSNQHSCYYNSLPKHAGMGIPPRNAFAPIRGKKSGKTSKSPKGGKKANTNSIPRSNSSQALRQQNGGANQKLPTENSRNRGSDSKKNGKYANESSSTDQSATITPKRRSKRLLSSRSVPFKLELLEMEQNGGHPPGFSESLPNLAPPPPAFSNSPPLSMKSRNRTSSSESTSSLSEQSGWVSSHRSSLPSSPETLKNEQQRAFNGEQLRKKLLKLLQEQPQRKGLAEKKRSNSGRVVNGFSQHKRHSSGNAIERNKSLTFNGKSSAWESLHNDWVGIPPIAGSPLHNGTTAAGDSKDRQMTLDSKVKPRARKPSEKSKSDFDLTSLPMDQPFEDLRLPPPQQFQDIAPLPPDEFR